MKHKRYTTLLAMVLLLTGVARAQLLVIQQGTTVTNSGSMVFDKMSLVNNGSFTNAVHANVTFLGSGDRFIQGGGNTQFYHLYLNKTANNLLLQSNIKVAGNLLLSKGSLDLGSNSLQLIYPNGLIQNETDSTRVFSNGGGVAFIELPLNAPNNVDPGNLGFTIFSAQNMGTTTVYRTHDVLTNAYQQQSIKRQYKIVPANTNNMLYNIRFTYLDAELNNVPEPSAALHQKVGNGAWTHLTLNGVSNVVNFRERFDLTALDQFTLFPQAVGAPLPLQLLQFTVQCKDNSAMLQWITANEVATKGFVVEKSDNGTNWVPVKNLAAQGHTAQHTYSTLVAGGGASFYRLKMEDLDGTFTYSPVRKVSCDDKNLITVGPNPTTGPLNISFQLTRKEAGIIQLLDSKGSLLQSRSFNAAPGLSVETINMTTYPSGTYIIRITGSNGMLETRQIIKR